MKDLAAGAAYLAAAAVVLAAGLAAWTQFHLPLRDLGPASVMFLLVFFFLGIPAFAAAAWITHRRLPPRSALRNHLAAVGPLHLLALTILTAIVLFPPRAGLEGGDIALRTLLFICLMGIAVDLLATWRRRSRT